jgi:hypothetical protein
VACRDVCAGWQPFSSASSPAQDSTGKSTLGWKIENQTSVDISSSRMGRLCSPNLGAAPVGSAKPCNAVPGSFTVLPSIWASTKNRRAFKLRVRQEITRPARGQVRLLSPSIRPRPKRPAARPGVPSRVHSLKGARHHLDVLVREAYVGGKACPASSVKGAEYDVGAVKYPRTRPLNHLLITIQISGERIGMPRSGRAFDIRSTHGQELRGPLAGHIRAEVDHLHQGFTLLGYRCVDPFGRLVLDHLRRYLATAQSGPSGQSLLH